MSALDPEQREILREMLNGALPVNPQPNAVFVSREEFDAKISTIETKIENASLKQRNWVLAGCLAVILTFGGGYVSLMSKLDGLTQAMPAMAETLNGRSPWMQRTEAMNTRQDAELHKLDPEYQPIPYQEVPR